jgi:hypothetical protein
VGKLVFLLCGCFTYWGHAPGQARRSRSAEQPRSEYRSTLQKSAQSGDDFRYEVMRTRNPRMALPARQDVMFHVSPRIGAPVQNKGTGPRIKERRHRQQDFGEFWAIFGEMQDWQRDVAVKQSHV